MSSTIGRRRRNKESKPEEDGSERKDSLVTNNFVGGVPKASRHEQARRSSERNRKVEDKSHASEFVRKSEWIEGSPSVPDVRNVAKTETRDARSRSDVGSERILRRTNPCPPLRLVPSSDEKGTFSSPTDPLSNVGRASTRRDPERSFPKEGEQFLLQLPYHLPLAELSDASVDGMDRRAIGTSPLDLPRGKLGELVMYDDGDVELHVGGVSYRLVLGVPTEHRQEVVVVREGPPGCDQDEIVRMGGVERTYLVVPDVPSLLDERHGPSH